MIRNTGRLTFTPRTFILAALLLVLVSGAGCDGNFGTALPDSASTGSPEPLPMDTSRTIELSRAALAAQLQIEEGEIALEGVVEPTGANDATIVLLSAGGQLYEYHGRNDQVVLVSEPLPQATVVAQSARPAITLTLPTSVAADYSSRVVPASGPADDQPTWAVYPAHTAVSFSEYRHSDSFSAPEILVYPAAEMSAVNESAAVQISSLQELLSTRSELAGLPELPFLPFLGAQQMFHARAGYLDFAGGSGLRYVTQNGQAAGPINNRELLYTFQGLTGDGSTYVTAVFPIAHPDLPRGPEAFAGDFPAGYDAYLQGVVQSLNEAGAASFTPDLAALDELVASIVIDAVAAEPGADRLAGSSWVLRAMGAPDQGTPVPPGSEISLEFSAESQAGGALRCNSYGGSYRVAGENIYFGEIFSTLMACAPDGAQELDDAYLAALQSAQRYALSGEELTIWYGDGRETLTFRAAAATPDGAPQTAVHSQADLVFALEDDGASVALNTEPVPAADIFSIPGQQINVNGQVLDVYLYPDARAAAADAARLSADGYGIAPPPGSASEGPTVLDWAAPPRFYRWDNLIVLYVGEDDEVAHLLERIAGPPFAGS